MKHMHKFLLAHRLSVVCLRPCSSPNSLSVHYNLQNVGMEYDRSLFGMKLADCRSLAKSLEANETLTYLDVSNNSLDDDKVSARDDMLFKLKSSSARKML